MKRYRFEKDKPEAEKLNEFLLKTHPKFYKKPNLTKHDPWNKNASENQQFKRKWKIK